MKLESVSFTIAANLEAIRISILSQKFEIGDIRQNIFTKLVINCATANIQLEN